MDLPVHTMKWLSLLVTLAVTVGGAGMVTHNVIARRATEFERWSTEDRAAAFEGLSKDRVDALQGGSPFPDYLYACGDDHNAGEVRERMLRYFHQTV